MAKGILKVAAKEVAPHGRLIDADEIINKLEEEQHNLTLKLPYETGRIWEASLITRMIKDAPTVIESNK